MLFSFQNNQKKKKNPKQYLGMMDLDFWESHKCRVFAIWMGLHGPVGKHWFSHHCGSSLTQGTCEMPSSAPVGQVFFPRYSGFRPPLINDRLDISEIVFKGL